MSASSSGIAVTSRDDLISLLEEAAELEHGLCCSYLFAAFSLKTSDDGTLTGEQAEAVSRWYSAIVGVAMEEMLHLSLVANLLTAIGGSAHFSRPSLPQTSRYYPGGLSISLRRFDEATLSRFMHLERPADMEIEPDIVDDDDVDLDRPPPDAAPGSLVPADDVDPKSVTLTTVGQLYDTIETGFVALTDSLGAGVLFIGNEDAQADADTLGVSQLTPVTDLKSARTALRTLVDQGEGVRGDWTDAHYGQFRRLREELRRQVAADPGFDPAWPCAPNPTAAETIPSDDQTLITAPTARDLLGVFNGTYTLMSAMLQRCFIPRDESTEGSRFYAHTARSLMSGVLAPVGRRLAATAASEGSDQTAGASFDLHRTPVLTTSDRATRIVLRERLQQLDALARHLDSDTALTQVADCLEELSLQM